MLRPDRTWKIGAPMILSELRRILAGVDTPTPQPDKGITYDARITKSDGVLDFTKSAIELDRQVRAYLGWPGSRTSISGRDITVTACHVVDTQLEPGKIAIQNLNIVIGTSDQSLGIDRMKPAGKSEMTSRDFISGIPELR